ncbi:hypothetical protein GIC83_25085 [Salmonella enterica]|nr:hypothetical protein [Salmonella enterica]EDZ9225332.1 hypothetical protein [Salmonella enterica]EEC5199485.1 hypothetical protein [Salmonella enterica]
MAITTEQIMKAADELDREGQTPTLARVRKKPGGGSFTTISEVMIEWRSQKTRSVPLTNRLRRLSPTDWPLSGMISGHWRWKLLTPVSQGNGERWKNHGRKQKKQGLRPLRWPTN